jgi:ribonuclease HI
MSANLLSPGDGLLVYTDGAYSGKSGYGGWAYVAVDINLNTEEVSGCEPDSTNNRMELMAPIQALTELFREYGACEIEIITDSKYVCTGIQEWVAGWKKRGWTTSNGEPVKNRELWERLEEAIGLHTYVGWRHVRGHQGHKWNERADTLAVEARQVGEYVEEEV